MIDRAADQIRQGIGEIEGLKKSNAVEKKKRYETSLISKNQEIKTTLDQLNNLYNDQAPYALNNAYRAHTGQSRGKIPWIMID